MYNNMRKYPAYQSARYRGIPATHAMKNPPKWRGLYQHPRRYNGLPVRTQTSFRPLQARMYNSVGGNSLYGQSPYSTPAQALSSHTNSFPDWYESVTDVTNCVPPSCQTSTSQAGQVHVSGAPNRTEKFSVKGKCESEFPAGFELGFCFMFSEDFKAELFSRSEFLIESRRMRLSNRVRKIMVLAKNPLPPLRELL